MIGFGGDNRAISIDGDDLEFYMYDFRKFALLMTYIDFCKPAFQ